VGSNLSCSRSPVARWHQNRRRRPSLLQRLNQQPQCCRQMLASPAVRIGPRQWALICDCHGYGTGRQVVHSDLDNLFAGGRDGSRPSSQRLQRWHQVAGLRRHCRTMGWQIASAFLLRGRDR
jgi:hypothetical protein